MNNLKWNGEWAIGDVSIPITPEPGMLVEWTDKAIPIRRGTWHVLEGHCASRIPIDVSPLLPSVATLMGCGLTVEDGCSLIMTECDGVFELKLPGEYRIVTAGDGAALAQPSWVEDEDDLPARDDAGQKYAALLQWMEGNDDPS